MIVKIPLYFEIDVSIPSDELPTLLEWAQAKITKTLNDDIFLFTDYKLYAPLKGEEIKFSLRTRKFVMNLMEKGKKPSVKTEKSDKVPTSVKSAK